MRSVLLVWGLVVGNLFETAWTTCLRLSTHGWNNRPNQALDSGKRLFVRTLTVEFPTSFTQDILPFSYPLYMLLSPVSTGPIITNVMKGYKKQ